MEQIIKIIKAILTKEDGEVDKSVVATIREGIGWMAVGALILLGVLLYYADDEEDETEVETEYVESNLADNADQD